MLNRLIFLYLFLIRAFRTKKLLKKMNVKDIVRLQEEKQRKKLSIFESVLRKVNERIKHAVFQNENFCLYIIPEFLLGNPTYNIQHCTKYIMYHLQKNGFIVYFYSPNILSISWPIKDFQKTLISYEDNRDVNNNFKQIEYKPTMNSISKGREDYLMIEPSKSILPDNNTFSQKKSSPFKKIDTAQKINYFMEENEIGQNGGFFSKYRQNNYP